MRRRVSRVVFALLCVVGVVQAAAGMIVPAKAIAAQWLLARAFDRSVATGRPVRPWPWADMNPVARIAAPRLGVTRVVIDTGSGQAMAFGPTLLPGGAALGGNGAAVIAAHRDTHFAFLRDVKAGDLVTAQDLSGRIRRYRVTTTQVVRADRFAVARNGGSALALTTCWPFGTVTRGPWRYVVWARPEGR